MTIESPCDQVLAGLTVLELGTRIGASVAGATLAQLGATVVFVEAREAAAPGPTKLSCRAQFAAGKLSLLMAPGNAEDDKLLARLAAAADVVLLSSDMDPAQLRQVAHAAKGAVMCDITACGDSGPLAGRPYSDAQIQALSGILGCTGAAGSALTPIPLPLVEHMAGLYAAGAVLCALRRKRIDGHVQTVEVSLYDVGFAAMTSFLAPALYGQEQSTTRVGNRHTMAAPWNVYRAADGWLLLCAGSDEQWRRICRLIGQEPLATDPAFAKNADRVAHVDAVDAVVQAWVASRSVQICVASFSELGLPCGPVAPIDQYPREANLTHRCMVRETHDPVTGQQVWVPGSVFHMSRSGGQALLRIPLPDEDRAAITRLAGQPRAIPVPAAAQQQPCAGPLAGVRVLEIGHYTTVPIAARTLASLGAEVIKIEPAEGEAVRRWPPARNGQGIFFTFQNSDKKSVCLDMETQAGRDLLRRLIASADILVENLRPGALGRKGFSPEEVVRINPRLVYCSISGFGADSLYPGRAAFDMVIQAMSGLMDVNGVDGMPMKTGPSLADVMGAACGFTALVAALEYRDACGLGQYVDLSMQDMAAWATQTLWNGGPRGPRFAARAQGRPMLGEGSDAVPVLAVHELLDAPQTLARELWFQSAGDGASFPLLAVPLRLDGVTPPVLQPAPALGRDNDSITRTLARATAPLTEE